MTGCVLDASVAAKWFLPWETLAEEALRLLKRHNAGELRMIVPDLFWTELGNVLWKSVRAGRISERAAGEAAGSGLPLVTADERLVRALGTVLPVRYRAVAD